MEREPNWVDRRAKRHALLIGQSGQVWEKIRGAIRDACDSFNENYPTFDGEPPVRCNLEDGKRVSILHSNIPLPDSAGLTSCSLLVVYDPNSHTIVSPGDGGRQIDISADEDHGYPMYAGKEISIDEPSKILVETVLFPDGVRLRPHKFVKP